MLQLQDIPLHAAPFIWCVAGGWALDLFIQEETRPHGDLDLQVFRNDQLALQTFLSRWSLFKVADGETVRWKQGEVLSLPVHEVHAIGTAGETIEILLAESDGSNWIYRRDPAVTMPLADALVVVAGGIRVLAPEIVLLFKSKDPREIDELDFENLRHRITTKQSKWLVNAIQRTGENHPWAAKLAT